MPYFSATYSAAQGKIYATMGPYIVTCNATTGARESVTRLANAPIYGNMPICFHTATGYLFVGSGDTPNKQIFDAFAADPPVYKDIYRVHPVTMAITACGVNNQVMGIGRPLYPDSALRGGPYNIIQDGAYILFQFRFSQQSSAWARMNATSFVCNGGWFFHWPWEQCAVDANYIYGLDPLQREVEVRDKTLSDNLDYITSISINPHFPSSLCYSTADAKVWVVCGNVNLLRVNSQVDLDYTLFDLTAVVGPTLPPDPCRIQCLSDGMLYLPCMAANGIIIFNPLLGTGTWKGGFEGPIDVVEAGAKKFAVQNSPVGLKEIV